MVPDRRLYGPVRKGGGKGGGFFTDRWSDLTLLETTQLSTLSDESNCWSCLSLSIICPVVAFDTCRAHRPPSMPEDPTKRWTCPSCHGQELQAYPSRRICKTKRPTSANHSAGRRSPAPAPPVKLRTVARATSPLECKLKSCMTIPPRCPRAHTRTRLPLPLLISCGVHI